MAFTEKISLVVDVVTGQSRSSLNRLKTDLAGADGAFGKMKVGAAGAFDYLKQNAGTAALAAGTAMVAFGVKSVTAFQETALGAGQLASSIGVTTEEASRLQEVAGDLGVGVSSMERAIGRMNREIATSPEKFAAMGAEIAKNADGTTNVTQTFLNVVDALNKIEDPAQRAVAAQGVLGRGWQDLSRIIALGGDDIASSLARVEKAKIISPAEVERAERFRDTLDQLKGVSESVSLIVGGELVDAFGDLTTVAEGVAGPLDSVKDTLESMPGGKAATGFISDIGPAALLATSGLGIFINTLDAAAAGIDWAKGRAVEISSTLAANLRPGFVDAGEAASNFESRVALTGKTARDAGVDLKDFYSSVEEGKERLTNIANAQQEAADAAKEHSDALLEQAGILQEQADAARASVDAGFALRDAQRDAEEAAQAVNDVMADEDATLQDLAAALDDSSEAALKVADAQVRQADEAYKAAGATLSASQKVDIHNRSLLDQAATLEGPARQALIDHIAQLNGIPPEVASEIQALIDQGKLDEANTLLANTSRTRSATIEADAKTADAERRLSELERARYPMFLPQVGALPGSGNRRQHGGPVTAGQPYLVGEKGPEVMVPGMNGTVIPNAGGHTPVGGGMNVTINMPPGSDGRDVVAKIKQYERVNGTGWRQ